MVPKQANNMKGLKIFVSEERPMLQTGELYENNPFCGTFAPTEQQAYEYFEIEGPKILLEGKVT